MAWKDRLEILGEPAVIQVQQMTSSLDRTIASASACSFWYLFSSADESSPVSLSSCCSFLSSGKESRLRTCSCRLR